MLSANLKQLPQYWALQWPPILVTKTELKIKELSLK